jgi:hypothetical protein
MWSGMRSIANAATSVWRFVQFRFSVLRWMRLLKRKVVFDVISANVIALISPLR